MVMISNELKERYKELLEGLNDLPHVRLELQPSEQRGDDCGSSVISVNNKDNYERMLSKINSKGFIYNYCLSDNEKKKVLKKGR